MTGKTYVPDNSLFPVLLQNFQDFPFLTQLFSIFHRSNRVYMKQVYIISF